MEQELQRPTDRSHSPTPVTWRLNSQSSLGLTTDRVLVASLDAYRLIYSTNISKLIPTARAQKGREGIMRHMKLNLGSFDVRLEGFMSVDIDPTVNPDFCADLNFTWPWVDSSIEEVVAVDVFEHLVDKRHTMNELWRILIPGGTARVVVPHATLGDGGHCDPTHVSYWTQSDFEYYTPFDGFGRAVGERSRFRNSSYYGINADFRIMNLDGNGHIPLKRYDRRYGGFVVSIEVVLQKLVLRPAAPETTDPRAQQL